MKESTSSLHPPSANRTSQTLDRGLTALEFIAFSDQPPMIDDVARYLQVHRSIAYRLVRTLEDHSFVRRGIDGRCLPGERLAALGRNVRLPLQAAALPQLTAMADDLGMTSFLVIRIGDEAVTIESVEPRTTSTHVAYRPGSRHAIDRGAPGLALLAGRPAVAGERAEVTLARQRGWACSSGEVTPGLASVASWVPGPDGHVVAAIACVYLAGAQVDLESVSSRVCAGAVIVTHTIGGLPMITGTHNVTVQS